MGSRSGSCCAGMAFRSLGLWGDGCPLVRQVEGTQKVRHLLFKVHQIAVVADDVLASGSLEVYGQLLGFSSRAFLVGPTSVAHGACGSEVFRGLNENEGVAEIREGPLQKQGGV